MVFMALISGIINVGLSAFILWHLSNIFRYGEFTVLESNTLILVGETVAIIAFLIFGVYLSIYFYKRIIRRYIWDIRSRNKYIETEYIEGLPDKIEGSGYLVSLRDYVSILQKNAKNGRSL